MSQDHRPLHNTVSLVTGGAIRVGKAIAMELAKNGSHIALHYNTSTEDAKKAKREIEEAFHVKVELFQANLANPSEIHDLVKNIVLRFKKIDILVNSASIFYKTPFATVTEKDFDEMIAINLKAPFLLSKYCGDLMLKQKKGHIVNIADWTGLHPGKNHLPYYISKGGLITMTNALALELAPDVQVNCVAPGPVLMKDSHTEEHNNILASKAPLQRIGSPEDVAKAVLYLVKDACYTTGAVIPVEGGRLLSG